MLYLEDYIEMIEYLPRELRDGFTELREIDLKVHNSTDALEERVRTFFGNARKMKPQERDGEFDDIRKHYYKSLEDCDEKVQISGQMYDLVDRHLRRLDHELHKFKLELEADHAGITELLERRSLEMDSTAGSCTTPSAADCHKENRMMPSTTSSRRTHERKSMMTNQQASRREDRSLLDGRVAMGVANGAGRLPASAASYMNAAGSCVFGGASGGSALAAAASQAIAATQHMQQGRRTSGAASTVKSSSCSYEPCSHALLPSLSCSTTSAHSGACGAGCCSSADSCRVVRELAGAAHTALLSSGLATVTASGAGSSGGTAFAADKRKRKCNTSSTSGLCAVSPALSEEHLIMSSAELMTEDQTCVSATTATGGSTEDWLYDANEPRYCVCQNVSYGDMVACDNRECPYEWFHYACVGITAPPKGKWYCPQCLSSMKRRRQK